MYAPSYIWAKVLSRLEQQLTEIAVNAWFDDTDVIELTNERFVVYSPSDFRQQIIRDRCGPYIREILRELLQADIKFEVWGDAQLHQYRTKTSMNPACFNPQFTFESFISGDSNRIAAKVTEAAANKPGQVLYNPLFLYGPSGVGKTHLLHAIMNRVMELYPEKKVAYVRSDQFTAELINGIVHGTTEEFRTKYRQADVFLIDDIQFIAGKESTQEEFFQTFNDLYEHGGQIVMTSDRKPQDIATLEDRLKSRFGAGVMIGIEAPDYTTRLAVTRAKAELYKLKLDEDSMEYIARAFPDNIRQIEGALKRLRAFHELDGLKLTPENVRQTLADACENTANIQITPELVIRNVCKYYGVEEQQLQGAQRGRNIAEPRQVAMYLLRTLAQQSFPQIGKLLERDQSSVQYCVKKVEKLLRLKDNHLENVIRDITANIQNTPY